MVKVESGAVSSCFVRCLQLLVVWDLDGRYKKNLVVFFKRDPYSWLVLLTVHCCGSW